MYVVVVTSTSMSLCFQGTEQKKKASVSPVWTLNWYIVIFNSFLEEQSTSGFSLLHSSRTRISGIDTCFVFHPIQKYPKALYRKASYMDILKLDQSKKCSMCSTGSNFLLSPKQEKSLAACGPDLFCHFAHKMLGLGLGGKASQPNFQTPDREWKCLQSSYAALPYPLYNTVLDRRLHLSRWALQKWVLGNLEIWWYQCQCQTSSLFKKSLLRFELQYFFSLLKKTNLTFTWKVLYHCLQWFHLSS